MKVIEKGREQRGWSEEIICTGAGNGNGGCGAKLLIEQPDLFHTIHQVKDETDYFVTFECCECGVLTDIKNSPFSPRSLPHRSKWKMNNLVIALGSGSAVKINALQKAMPQAQIIPVKEARSDINEQPIGEVEILEGALNRVLSARILNPGADFYVAIENGLSYKDDKWFDYAIIYAYVAKGEYYSWTRSEAVEFPTEAVTATKLKPGGFAENTVGKTLKEMGIVTQHDDPHKDLVGKSRAVILEEALTKLFSLIQR